MHPLFVVDLEIYHTLGARCAVMLVARDVPGVSWPRFVKLRIYFWGGAVFRWVILGSPLQLGCAETKETAMTR